MSAASGPLSEPPVLAHTKRRLFPGTDDDDYAVTDTQFRTNVWLVGEPVDTAVRETLAPFNRVRVGSGYPDLVGVRVFEPELLAVERFGESLSLTEKHDVADTEFPVDVGGYLTALARHELSSSTPGWP